MIDAPLHFAPVPPRLTPQWESLLGEADRVCVTSEPLASLARAGGAAAPRVIGNGVDSVRFGNAAPAFDAVPGDAGMPIVGYVGSLHSWFDVPLVSTLARALPGARVVLIGPAHPATRREIERASRSAPNLFWMDRQPYERIPALIRTFRVGLIPFLRTPLTEAVNPVKLYEYAAAGVPCVTTRFTDLVTGWREAAEVADDAEQFVALVAARLAAPADPQPLVAFARRHDWDEIAREFVHFCLGEEA
jgi:glycosyltransferase involved in cell wall biosynthesis